MSVSMLIDILGEEEVMTFLAHGRRIPYGTLPQLTSPPDGRCDYLFCPENLDWRAALYVFASQMREIFLYRDIDECGGNCLKRMWKTERHPFPTVNQLNRILENMRVDSGSRVAICRIYLQFFPWARYARPRSLQHLSRCTINSQMRSNVDVDKLPLPDKLKAYLRFVSRD